MRFASVLRAHRMPIEVLVLSRGTQHAVGTSVRAVHPLYPRGPRSGPGYSVPVHPHLIDPIRPTREHNPTSPRSGLYEMSSLCIGA